jgi:RNA polymerase sigma-70 factor (ECF subfamily)
MATRRSHVPLSLVVGGNPRATSDGDLARGLAAGESWAIAETWHRFAPMVLALAERALGSRSEADDLGQEVLYCAFRKIKTLREPDSMRSFVYSIAVRALKSELRRKRLRGWLTFHPPETLVDLTSRTMDMESRDLLRKCQTLLDRLSPRDRLVFILRRMESMTVEEIAAAMDLSLSTVKRSMAHASNRLLRWIAADPGLAGRLEAGRWER